ncbi:P-loop containing nucleoside triphosphate hydrolase protein [Lentinula raphanica]|nr:P-loop containing nucleoside triphosphate hydrolase protein [Lentinula raphanica]
MASNATSVTEPNVAPTSTPISSADTVPLNISSIITFLFSLSALRDWLKLILIGGFFETCRQIVFGLYYKMVSAFWVNAYFDGHDACYDWLMVWLSKQPSWKRSRDVQISTQTYGAKSSAITLDGEENHSSSLKSFRKLSYLPSLSVTYSLWYKGCYMTITRTQEQVQNGWFGEKEQTLNISILTRNRDILVHLLQEARTEYIAAQEHHMCIFAHMDGWNNGWTHVASRSKRSLNSIILDPGIKEMLVEDARGFLESKAWYAERGIPFRRGYLLWGAPGSGKSSLIHALAGELGLDIYVVSLGKAGLDDSSLNSLINQLPERCIALMEDIDAAFTTELTRDNEAANDSKNPQNPGGSAPSLASTQTNNRVTLSGLLNTLDADWHAHQLGRILFATTNKFSSLDPALRRPGRMDVHIEFKLASKYQARELFYRFFHPGDVVTGIDDDESDSDESDGSSDSGYSSRDKPEKVQLIEIETPTVHDKDKLTNGKLRSLANEFADAIPEHEFSMAALQGYLMMHKTAPLQAIEQVGIWSQKEKEDRAAKDQPTQHEPRKEDVKLPEETEKEKLEKEITQRVEKEVRERLERERFEKELMERIEKEMTAKMEELFNGQHIC